MGFWDRQRVLVTGGAGFLGKYVVRRLTQAGASVCVPTRQEYDLLRADQIDRMYDAFPADLVLHLAARVGGIGANLAHPGSYFYENLLMGVQLLHKAWERRIPKFVALGTVCAYPKHAPVPFSETALWDGYPEETNAPYGLAKKMLLVQSEGYRREYGYNSIFLLPCNLYGPGDNFDPASSHVIPALIRKCVEAVDAGAQEVVVWGDGAATREFLFVEDAAEAVLLAAERYDASAPVNIGSAVEISIRELADQVARATGFCGKFKWDSARPNGQPRRKLDVSRAKAAFGFEARTAFAEGLAATVRWYRANRPPRGVDAA